MEKSGNSFRCYFVSWDMAYRLGRKIALNIRASGFVPDIIIGVSRGGLVPTRIICDFLHQNNLATVKVEHWGIAETLGKARIKYSLPEEIDISEKRILIVDDVADTGETYKVIIDYLKEKEPAEIRTAALHYKTSSSFIPDHWGEKHDGWMWIIYPWALYEDMTGFIRKVLINPMTQDDVRKNLRNIYNIKIPSKELIGFMNDMKGEGKLIRNNKCGKFYWENTGETK